MFYINILITIYFVHADCPPKRPAVVQWVPQLHLTPYHLKVISEGKELDDLHMDAVTALLRDSYPLINGLQPPMAVKLPQLLKRRICTIEAVCNLHVYLAVQ